MIYQKRKEISPDLCSPFSYIQIIINLFFTIIMYERIKRGRRSKTIWVEPKQIRQTGEIWEERKSYAKGTLSHSVNTK